MQECIVNPQVRLPPLVMGKPMRQELNARTIDSRLTGIYLLLKELLLLLKLLALFYSLLGVLQDKSVSHMSSTKLKYWI